MSVIDRNVTGAAAQVRVAVALASGESGTMVVDVSTGWPSSHFVAVIDRSTADEEKVLLASRSGNVWTIAARGFDGTSARDHAEGATVELILDAVMIQAFLDHVNANLEGDVHEQYLLAADLTQEAINALEVDAHTIASHTWDDILAADTANSDAIAELETDLGEEATARDAAIALAIGAATTVETEITPSAPSLGVQLTDSGSVLALSTIDVADYPPLPDGASAADSRLYVYGVIATNFSVAALGDFQVTLIPTSLADIGVTALIAKQIPTSGFGSTFPAQFAFRAVFTDANKCSIRLLLSASSPDHNVIQNGNWKHSIGAHWVARPA